MSDCSTDNVAAELDRLRDEAEAAFIARDVKGYMRLFSPYISYKQSNGSVLNYSRLTADVEKQMPMMPSIQILRTRESFEQTGNTVVEVLKQDTTMTATALFFITRILEMTKTGKYVWTNTADGWQISEVEILKDGVQSHWALGFVKPRRIF